MAGPGTLVIFVQPPAGRYFGICWLRGSQSWTEKDEPSLQTRVSDVSVTLLCGTDPVRGGGDSAGVAPAFADPLVSLQASYSPRRVYGATRVSGLLRHAVAGGCPGVGQG